MQVKDAHDASRCVMQWYARTEGVYIDGFTFTQVDGPIADSEGDETDQTPVYYVVHCNVPNVVFHVYATGVVHMRIH